MLPTLPTYLTYVPDLPDFILNCDITSFRVYNAAHNSLQMSSLLNIQNCCCFIVIVLLQLFCYCCFVVVVLLLLFCCCCFVFAVLLLLLCYCCFVVVVSQFLRCFSTQHLEEFKSSIFRDNRFTRIKSILTKKMHFQPII